MTASAITEEMRPKGKLRPVIGKLADAGGAYIIFSAQGSLADEPLTSRRNAMRDAIADHPKAGLLHIDFYDRDRMATWTNRYPGVAAWVRARLGRELSGWRPVGNWSDGSVANGSPYLQNDHACLIDERSREREKLTIADGIARLREALSQPRRAVRLIGLSGLGKTRLVQALFETGVGDKPLDPAVAIYTDYSEQTSPTAREMARRLVDINQHALLIVDNCNPTTHAELANIAADHGGQLSLLTVEYDVSDDEPEHTEVFRLENTSPALVEEWLQQNFDHVSQVDRSRIATFSDGNFRVARALAGTLRRGETLGRLRDRQLFERIFQQRNAPDQQLLLAAEDLSLLYSFNGEDTSEEGELAIIGTIRGVKPPQLYGHVAELKRRGVVQSRGPWRAILPHAIANPLATFALQRLPPADFDGFCTRLTVRMLKSVSKRLGFLHDSPEAGKAVARWLLADGPLGNLFVAGELGLEIVRNISPVAPRAVLEKILAELLGPNGARILSPKNSQRGRWITIIKTLGYDADLFRDATYALALFIAVEPDEQKHDTGKRHFDELFQLYLSGTKATPAARHDVIRQMAASDDAGMRSGAARALDSMLEALHFSSFSNHDFGARPRDFGWQPQTYEEVYDWYNSGVGLAVELTSTLPAARKVLADNVRGIWGHARCHEALAAASVKLSRKGPWIDGWIAFKQTLAYDGASMSDEIRARLVGIVDNLKPTDLLNQARATVLTRSSGAFVTLEGDASDPLTGWRLADRQAVDLGRAFANEPEMLATFLQEIYAEIRPHRAFQFGKGLAEGAADVGKLWGTLLEAFKAMPVDGRNATTLGGYIHGASTNPEFVATVLDEVADDKDVVRNLTYLQSSAGIDRDGIARLSAALEAGRINAGSFHQLATGVVAGSPSDALAALLTKLAHHSGGSEVALNILRMKFHCTKSEGREYDANLLLCGRQILAAANYEGGTSLNDYGVSEVAEVCLANVDGEATARTMCRTVREGLDSYKLSVYQIGHLLQALLKVQPNIALDALLLGDEHVPNRQLERRLPLNNLDVAILRGWTDIDPAIRYPLIGQLLSIFDVKGLDEAAGLSSTFLEMMESAPDRMAFLGEAHNRLIPNGWSGSLANLLERRRAMLEPLAGHQDKSVKDWLSGIDLWVVKRIEDERLLEKKREERFE